MHCGNQNKMDKTKTDDARKHIQMYRDGIRNDKTKKPITPTFILYIEYTFIHFGMSISCKQGSLLISK